MEGVDIDFDLTTEKGRENFNETVNDEFESLLPEANEERESWNQRISNRFGRYASRAKQKLRDLWGERKKGVDIPEYMELQDMGEPGTSGLGNLDRQREEVLDKEIKDDFPEADTTGFMSRRNEDGLIEVKSLGKTATNWYVLSIKDGKLNSNIPITVRRALGEYKPLEKQIEEGERFIDDAYEKIEQRDEQRQRNIEERPSASSERQRQLDAENTRLEAENEQDRETIAEREEEVENLQERQSLRDRVKAIFKKYGFTVTAVITAVGVVIGVIVSNLKAGLTSVAKGVGNGLKTLGKKLGELLPGMVGAIASFLFKTAGEVVGFLAKNAWLLIVAVVLYFVERFKKRRRS